MPKLDQMQRLNCTFTSPIIVHRGLEDYAITFAAMRQFTDSRDATTPDQLWIVEHPPVFTLGLGASNTHILKVSDIPIIQTDRGGEVTYHGPGQVIVYLLIDLRRNHTKGRLFAREFVHQIEQAAIDCLQEYNLYCERKIGAPGIYLPQYSAEIVPKMNEQWAGAKIAALGLKVRGNGCTYHGVSLNVDMDLTPFTHINPCGYAGLATIDMRTLGATVSLYDMQIALSNRLQQILTTSVTG